MTSDGLRLALWAVRALASAAECPLMLARRGANGGGPIALATAKWCDESS
jgi:hypothetical protein